MVFQWPRLLALVCGVLCTSSIVACESGGDAASEQAPTSSVASPYLRENDCSAADSSKDEATPDQRMSQLSQKAGEMLLTNGIAPGPDLAVDGQLTSSQAADRASTVPGDASIAEALWGAALRPDASLDPVRDTAKYYTAQAQQISTFEVTKETLSRLLGPSWLSVVEVVGDFAGSGYERYVEQVRDAPAMRAEDAAARRDQLRAAAVDAGLESQWDTAQSIVPVYFQSCAASSTAAGAAVDLESSVLAEVVAADAVAAAFAVTVGPPELGAPLALGLQIALGAEPTTSGGGGELTKKYDPNEILSPEDAELMEAEEPSLDGP